MRKTFILFIFSFIFSCAGCSGPRIGDLELDLVWHADVPYYMVYYMELVDDTIYAANDFGCSAVDAQTGEVVWSYYDPENIPYTTSNPAVAGDNIFVACQGFVDTPARMLWFSKQEGFLGVIQLGEDASYMPRYFSIQSYEDMVLWGAANYPSSDPRFGEITHGLVGFTISSISSEPNTETGYYTIDLETLYHVPGFVVSTDVVFHEGNAFFGQEYSGTELIGIGGPGAAYDPPMEVICVNTETWQQVWRDQTILSVAPNMIHIYEDYLYHASGVGMGLRNMTDGMEVYEEFTIPLLIDGLVIEGGFAYGSCGGPVEPPGNVHCFNIETGEYRWHYLLEGSGTLGTNPQVHNGYVYVAVHNGIYVLDADNGSLVGVDQYLHGPMGQHGNTLRYGNNMICYDTINQRLISFEMDVHERDKLFGIF